MKKPKRNTGKKLWKIGNGACNFCISLGEIAIDSECDPGLNGFHHIEKTVYFATVSSLLLP